MFSSLPVDLSFWLAASLAALISGISKSGFGSSAAFAAITIFTLVASPFQAIAIMLPVLLVIDFANLYAWRGCWRWSIARPLIFAAMIGVIMASFIPFDEHSLKIGIAILALLFLASLALRPKPKPASKWGGWILAMIGGVTSFAAHAGGPPIIIHMLRLGLDKTSFNATIAVIFAAINCVKIVPYTVLGLFDMTTLIISALLIPLAILGVLLGLWAHKRISEKLYRQMMVTLTAIASCKLLIDSF